MTPMLKQRVTLITSFIILLLCTSVPLFAQPGDPGGDPDVPISGIEILIAVGGIIGVKKMLRNKKRE
jgi:hypothetical protein